MHVWNGRKPTTGLRPQLVTISGRLATQRRAVDLCPIVAISATPWWSGLSHFRTCLRCSGGSPVGCWQSPKHSGSSDCGNRWAFPPSSLVFYLDLVFYTWINNSPDLRRALYILLLGWLFRSLKLWLLFGILRPCSEVSGKENSTSWEHPTMLT